jgi:hypothetical protein
MGSPDGVALTSGQQRLIGQLNGSVQVRNIPQVAGRSPHTVGVVRQLHQRGRAGPSAACH